MKSSYKVGDWCYGYDKYGVIYKRQVLKVEEYKNGYLYLLTGNLHRAYTEKEMFKRKKDCIAAMDAHGIKECKSLLDATIARQQDRIKLLERAFKMACTLLYEQTGDEFQELYDSIIEMVEEKDE